MKCKYKCIGLKENTVIYWNARFTIGEEYAEVKKLSSEKLYLYDDNSDECFVDADQFDLIPEVAECKELIAFAISLDPDLTDEQANNIANCGVSFKLIPKCK